MKLVDLELFNKKHDGEKLFVIGNGPSLTYEILDSLKDEKTFAMNNVAVAYPHTDWRPTYYLNVSRSFRGDKEWIERGMKSINEASHSFIWLRNAIVPFSIKTRADASITLLSCSTVPFWQFDVTSCVSRWGSSIFALLQIAAYMRFGHIFFIGCDLGYYTGIEDGVDTAHFDKDYLGETHQIRKWDRDMSMRLMRDEVRTFTCHEIAALKLLNMGIRTHLCNKGPLLEIYEYMSIEDAIAHKPTYFAPKKRSE